MDGLQIVLVALQYVAFLLALCVHEFAHAGLPANDAAMRCATTSAFSPGVSGRITVNSSPP